MTILGAVLDGPERAVIWGDSAVYNDGRATPGRVLKVIVNPLANLVGVGTGWGSFCREGNHAVESAAGFDELVAGLPKRLRAFSNAFVPKRHDASDFARNLYLVAGFSAEAGRMLICTFGGAAFFSSELASRFAAPSVDEIETFFPSHPGDALRIARCQANKLREAGLGVPGDLVIAELTRDHVSCVVVRDFAGAGEAEVAGAIPTVAEEMCHPGTSPFFRIAEPEAAALAAD